MLNRIGAVAASATLITVGTLALSGAALIGSESNLGTNNVDYGREQLSISSLSDLSNSSLPEKTDLSEPVAWGCWFCKHWG